MAATTDAETEAGPDPAVAWLEEKAKGFSKDADELRASGDRAAKALSALGTAGLAAVGIAKVGVIYPGSFFWWGAMLLAGFLSMVVSICLLVFRFWRANRPLPLSTDPGALAELDPHEVKAVEGIYEDAMEHAPFAEDVGVDIRAYELKADRWERDALYTPDSAISKRDLARVVRMRAEIEKAEQRAKLVVVRRRMHHALADWKAWLLAGLFVAGLTTFAYAADRLETNRIHQACTNAENTNLPKCEFYVKE